MPRKARACKCPRCGKQRITVHPEKICWDCRVDSLRSRPSQRQQWRCINTHCGRKVSGPDRTCQKCWGERLRAKGRAARQEFSTEHVVDREAKKSPSRSWWATSSREEFSANLQAEMPRLQAIGAAIPRSQRPTGDVA